VNESYRDRLLTINIRRRTLVKAAAATVIGAAATSALGACSAPPAKKDTITLAQSGGASLTDSFDPGITFLITTNLGHVFDNLIGATDDFQLRPGLAESWRIVDDLTWEFKLRKAAFHNGDPVTARDVKFTIDRIQRPDYESTGKANVANVSEVQVVDDQTVRMVTKIPYAALGSRLVSVLIVPEKYMNQVGEQAFAEKPIGSGPYKFVDWTKGDRVTLQASDHWWGDKPKVPKLVLRDVTEPSTRVALLLSGETDVIDQIEPQYIPQINADSRLEVRRTLSARANHVGMDTRKAPFDDVRVRQAMNYAVNWDSIIKNVSGGLGERVGAMSATTVPFASKPSVAPYPYDAQKALSLLADAGWRPGPDGVLARGDQRFEVDYDSSSGRWLNDKEIAQAVTQDLQRIGIKVNLMLAAWQVFFDKWNDKRCQGLWWWSCGATQPDIDFCYTVNYDSRIRGYYWNDAKNMDTRLDREGGTIDPAKRQELTNEMEQFIHDQAPHIFGFQEIQSYGVRKDLDWQPRVDERVFLWNADWKPGTTASGGWDRRVSLPVARAQVGAAPSTVGGDDCPCHG
jgi:peptide/nickel transport system substrate-binding protein